MTTLNTRSLPCALQSIYKAQPSPGRWKSPTIEGGLEINVQNRSLYAS